MSSNSLILRITHPDGSMRISVLEQDSIILGSGPGAGLQVPDPKVSNLHVMLMVGLRSVTAIDLGSEHGTCLGNELIRKPVSLSSGDILRIGQSAVEVVFGETAAPLTPRNPPVAEPRPQVLSRPLASGRTLTARKLEPVLAPPSEPRREALRRPEAMAWRLLAGPLPPNAKPTEAQHVLQASMLWHDQILAVEHVASNTPVSVGTSGGALFSLVDSAVGSKFELASFQKNTLEVRLPSGAKATVYSEREELELEELRHKGRVRQSKDGQELLSLSLHERARVQIADLGFLLRFIRPTPELEVRGMEKDIFFFLMILLGSLLLAVLSGFWVALRPPHAVSAAETLQNQAQYVRLIVKPKVKPRPARSAQAEKKAEADEGERAKDDEGRVGKPEVKKAEADPSRGGTRTPDKRAKELKRVHGMGLLGALSHGTASSVFGPGGIGSGVNSALGGLKTGAGMGDAHGIGGMGARGGGAGGGGLGLNVGGLGTRGMGTGGSGYGSIDLGGKGKDSTRIIPGKTTVVGGLDRDVIAKIIRQHQSEIRYCFELELQKNPELSGKVGATFIIDGTGAVSDANVAETTLDNSNTEQCMLSKIKRWKFPAPVGGGIVTVNFPWVFKPAGA